MQFLIQLQGHGATMEYLRDIGCHTSTVIAEWSQEVCFVTFHGLDVGPHNVTAETCGVQWALNRLK